MRLNTSGAATNTFFTHCCGRSVRISATTDGALLGRGVRLNPSRHFVLRTSVDIGSVAVRRADLAVRDIEEQLAARVLVVRRRAIVDLLNKHKTKQNLHRFAIAVDEWDFRRERD